MINLTTPYNPGDLDPGQSYTHARIIEFRAALDAKILTICVVYGYLDGESEWVQGKAPIRKVEINNKGSKYDLLIASATTTSSDEVQPGDGGHKCYIGTGRELYTYLINNVSGYAGVFV